MMAKMGFEEGRALYVWKLISDPIVFLTNWPLNMPRPNSLRLIIWSPVQSQVKIEVHKFHTFGG